MNIFILYFSFLASFFQADNPQLTIKIQNIEAVKGDIRIGVFNKSEKFLKKGLTYRNYKIPVKNKTETIIINDLPKGEYAFIMYHDKNADGELNRNFLGIPKEPFGFSNNVRPKLALPAFEDCKFILDKNLILKVRLEVF